jgi:bifunctional non-homologous end joining protein LigD
MPGRDPIPDWIDPELATLTRDRFDSPDWMFERKLDGERCITYRDGSGLRLMTRNQKVVTSTYPELEAALSAQSASEFIIDGEVVTFADGQTRFAQLQQRLGVVHPTEDLLESAPVKYFIFDVMYAGGQDLRRRPLTERKQVLQGLLDYGDALRFTEHRTGDGQGYFVEACRLGWEGLIAKLAAAPYRSGRTKDWLKFKCESGQEFVIGGFTDPQGTRIGLGALLLGYYDTNGKLVYAGKVGTGFDERTLHRLHDELTAIRQDQPPFDEGKLPGHGVHWTRPELVAEVGFSEWTTAGQLRHPRFQGLRRDKSAHEVIREVPQPHG